MAVKFAVGLLALTQSGQAGSATSSNEAVKLAFKEFMDKFHRSYGNAQEEESRFAIFEANYNFIEAENAKDQSYKLAINEFADQAPQEFSKSHLGMSSSADAPWKGLTYLGSDLYSGAPLPTQIDWTSKGAITPVKNQGRCGSCWSFSTTGALEGAWQIATGKTVSLSEQQLVDCSKENHGCQGGSMDLAFSYLMNHSSCTEDSYSYQGKQGTCSESKCTVGIPQGGVTGYKDVPENDEQALMEAVSQQPVSVAIEADQMAFQLYKSGVLTKTCGSKLDHGVLLVGYGTDKASGKDYWKIKNSWGPTWGDEGYIRIERGLKGPGECGIKAGATYPVVNGKVGPAPAPAPSPPSPTPPSPPSPAPPSPTPGCGDSEDFCKDKAVFDPAKDCEVLAKSCKKTCGCCDANPPSHCSGPFDQEPATIVV